MAEDAANTAQDAAPEPGKNVDQIRDILFGGQVRDYERRFARVEEEIARELAGLREDMDKRIKALQQFTTGEIESLSERLRTESREQRAAQQNFAKQTEQEFSQVGERIGKLEESNDKQFREMRQQHHDAKEAAEEALRRVQDELVATIRRESDELANAKVARADLAAMLTEVAMRLNQEFDLPEGQT